MGLVLREHHAFMGHVGVQKLIKEVDRRFVISESVNLPEAAKEIRRVCVACQACEAPNWRLDLPISHTPIQEYVMSSVCLDVFALPTATWGASL